ncbi:MAG: hypothetical protein WC696_00520 [Candidatus Methylopumilus sp.]|jgi:hypothetical protein
MDKSSLPFYQYSINSRAFLERARSQFDVFITEDSVDSFFNAALQLRFGIEARLTEYIHAAMRADAQEVRSIPEYTGTKLLKRLVSVDEDSLTGTIVRVTPVEGGATIELRFTPVTPRLAAIHGMLGELLHYKFFENNPQWEYKMPLTNKEKRTLKDFQALLAEGISQLEVATSGDLLNNPKFKHLVSEVIDEIEREDA